MRRAQRLLLCDRVHSGIHAGGHQGSVSSVSHVGIVAGAALSLQAAAVPATEWTEGDVCVGGDGTALCLATDCDGQSLSDALVSVVVIMVRLDFLLVCDCRAH